MNSEMIRAGARPRVWTALLAAPGALALAVVLQIAVVLIGMAVAGPGSFASGSEAATRFVTAPAMIVALVVASQLGFALYTLAAARLSAVPWRTRLGLVKGRLGLRWLPVLMLGTIFVQGLVATGLSVAFGEPSEHMKELAALMTAGTGLMAAAIVLAASLLPGVCEELLCRGFIQTRLVSRWGPVAGIGLTSVIFGLMHLDPMHALAAMCLGAWCGVVAWRAGSVWPAMACHFFNNLVGVMAARWYGAESWHPAMPGGLEAWAMIGLPAIAFGLSVVGLVRCGRGASPAGPGPVATVAA